MPWIPELFSAPVLERRSSDLREAHAAIPYFQGILTGETEALFRSFAGEPELHHPFRGRVKGRRAFGRYVEDTNAWLTDGHATIDDVDHLDTPGRRVEEALLTMDGDAGRIQLPVAIAADRDPDLRILELRLYYSTWPLFRTHANRPPLLQ